MDTSSPDLGQQRPESFDLLGIFLSAGDEPSSPPLNAGGNACSVSGCPCVMFVGKDPICETCGHYYSFHTA